MATTHEVHVQQHGEAWVLSGPGAEGFGVLNDYLGYLADRLYSPRTIRAYAFDLLHFVRWLLVECLRLEQVTTEVLLGYLAACRVQTLPGRPGDVNLRWPHCDGLIWPRLRGNLAGGVTA
jgi:hypothetical protein